MIARAYYNENDRSAAAWLRELIAEGLIAEGDVDERSVEDVSGGDLEGYVQHHWFAGIGGWSLALRYAGVPDDLAVWTGSCPCQPLSCAGSHRGEQDPRHLWPDWFRLVRERRPRLLFGEQVDSRDGREWLSGVQADLESAGYATASASLNAAGVGAPHIRQRLYWMAHALRAERGPEPPQSVHNGSDGGRKEAPGGFGARREVSRLGYAVPNGREGVLPEGSAGGSVDGSRPHGPWSGSRWLLCTDGKRRRVPVEPSLFPLAPGVSGRVGLLRGAGNAIVPPLAAQFIRAGILAIDDMRTTG